MYEPTPSCRCERFGTYLLYTLAYTCFVNLIRFVDAFDHIYDYVVVGQSFLKRDRVYEQEHTFSNLVSTSHPWLNLLYLNFSYHNAHHHDMRCPWYELPELHQRLYNTFLLSLAPRYSQQESLKLIWRLWHNRDCQRRQAVSLTAQLLIPSGYVSFIESN